MCLAFSFTASFNRDNPVYGWGRRDRISTLWVLVYINGSISTALTKCQALVQGCTCHLKARQLRQCPAAHCRGCF